MMDKEPKPHAVQLTEHTEQDKGYFTKNYNMTYL